MHAVKKNKNMKKFVHFFKIPVAKTIKQSPWSVSLFSNNQ